MEINGRSPRSYHVGTSLVARIQSTRYERYILTLIIYINIHTKVIIKTNIRHVFTSEVAQCPAECRNVKEEPRVTLAWLHM